MNAPKIPTRAASSKKLPAAAPRQAIVVLGMHRSGTSALTRVLSLAGYALPKTLMPAGLGNEQGHWESVPIMEFNDELLDAVGTKWDDWLPVNPRFLETPQWPAFVQKGVEVLRQEYGDAPMFVLKDPRICRIAPLWFEVLAQEQIDVRIILPIRDPLEVARSLAARNGFDEHFGLLFWLRHVLDAEIASRGRKRVFVSYDELLSDWQGLAGKIADTLDIVWPRLSPLTAMSVDDFVEPDLRRHRAAPADVARRQWMSPWVTDAMSILGRWANDGEAPEDYAALDSLTAALDRATPMFARPMITARNDRQRLLVVESDARALAEERVELEAQVQALVAAREALDAERTRLASELEGASSQLAELDQSIARTGAEHDSAQTELRERIARIQNDLRQREQEIGALASEREGLSYRLQQRDEEVDTLASERDSLLADVTNLRLAIDSGEAERARLAADLEAMQSRGAALDEEIARLGMEHAQAQQALCGQIRLAEDTLRQREEHIDMLDAERGGLVADIDRLQTKVSELEAARAHDAVDAAALNDAIRDLNALREEDARVRDTAEAARAELAIALETATARAAALETTLGALQLERADIDRQRRAQEAERAELAAALEKAKARANALEEELQQTAAEQDAVQEELRYRLGLSDSTLRQREEEIEQLGAERDKLATERSRLRDAMAAVEAQLAEQASTMGTLHQAVAASDALVAEQASEIESLRAATRGLEHDVARVEATAETLRGQLKSAEEGVAAANGALLAAQAERDAAWRSHAEARAEVAQRFGEIANLTQMLRASEGVAAENHDHVAWLRRLSDYMVRLPRWWSLMPRTIRQRWEEARLARVGLFDADGYRQRYPDVAASTIPPLEHYIRHGLDEGRSR